jgi:hypothetical protein
MPITIYAGQNYGSPNQQLDYGRYPKAKLTIGAGMLRSLKVPAGLEVTLYAQDNFQGERFVCTADQPTLPTFDKKTYSMIVLPATFPPVSATPPTSYRQEDLVHSVLNLAFSAFAKIPVPGASAIGALGAGILGSLKTDVSTRITEATQQLMTDMAQNDINNKLTAVEERFRMYVTDRNNIPAPTASQRTEFNTRLAALYEDLISDADIFNPLPYPDVTLPYYLRHFQLTVTIALDMMRLNNTYDEKAELSKYFTKAQAYLRSAIKARLNREAGRITSYLASDPRAYSSYGVDRNRVCLTKWSSGDMTRIKSQFQAICCREYFLRPLVRYQRLLDIHNGVVEVWGKINGAAERDKFKVQESEFQAEARVSSLPSGARLTALPKLVKRADGGYDLKFSHSNGRWWGIYDGKEMPNYSSYDKYIKWDWTYDKPGTVTYDVGTNPTGSKVVAVFTGSWELQDFSVVDLEAEKAYYC